MISGKQLKKGIKNPLDAANFMTLTAYGELSYYLRSINQWYHRRQGPPDGYRLMNEDWDTAIILDACRFDVFAECNRFEGILRKETAIGSESREYFQRTFSDKKHHDTVYVTGNPYITTLDEDTFHDVYLDEAWKDSGTEAPADRLNEAALEAHEDHPDKRIIVHYMQPHLPILAPGWEDFNADIRYHRSEWFAPLGVASGRTKAAYKANLEYVLAYVEELIEAIEGKAVITADHGELLGDRQSPIPIRGNNHHEELYVEGLLDVPWLEIDNGPRRDIVAESPVGSIQVNEQDKEDRLKALGYM